MDLDVEQFDQLESYLQNEQYATKHEHLKITSLSGGVSNKTVLVKFGDGRRWVIKQALPKLRVAVEWVSDPARIAREAQGLRRLVELAPQGTITPLIFLDSQHHILGMQAVPEPHVNWKTLLLAGRVDLDLVHQFGKLLASIHRRSSQQRQLLEVEFLDRSYFESLRLEPYYGYAAGQVPAAADFLQSLIVDTRQQCHTLVHGDYSPKNILVYQQHLVLLDHEVVHWGDPAFDVGFSLTHLLSKAHHLPQHRSLFDAAAQQYWQAYQQALADVSWLEEFEPRAVRHTLACLLARVAGRSPLEYLGPIERSRQVEAATVLMSKPPLQITQLIDQFLGIIAQHESH